MVKSHGCAWCGPAMMTGGAILAGVGLAAILVSIETSLNPWIVFGLGCLNIVLGWNVYADYRKNYSDET